MNYSKIVFIIDASGAVSKYIFRLKYTLIPTLSFPFYWYFGIRSFRSIDQVTSIIMADVSILFYLKLINLVIIKQSFKN